MQKGSRRHQMINSYVLSQVRIVCAKILTIKKLTLRLLRRHPGFLLDYLFRLSDLFFLIHCNRTLVRDIKYGDDNCARIIRDIMLSFIWVESISQIIGDIKIVCFLYSAYRYVI